MRFKCPNCGQRLEIRTIYSGQTGPCPACSAHIRIPALPRTSPAAGNLPTNTQLDTQIVNPGMIQAGMTISRFMAQQQLQGGIELGPISPEDSKSTALDVLTQDLETKYVVSREIFKGDAGELLHVKDVNLRRHVAMKVLLKSKEAGKARTTRFIEEAQITGQLEHPAIVPLHELGVDAAGNVYYTMKFIHGQTLHDVLQAIRRGEEQVIREYPLSRLLTIFQKVCDAVAFAHSRKVIHRDLTPENIMFGEYGEVLVMDWGLAKVRNGKAQSHKDTEAQNREEDMSKAVPGIEIPGSNTPHPMEGATVGTPGFMSPEQALGKTNELDERTDIYSLGAILYNILTLHPPIKTKHLADFITLVTSGNIPPPTQYNRGSRNRLGNTPLRHLPDMRVPRSLSAVCVKALERDPGKRYPTVKELQKEIAAYQNGFATSAENAGLRRQVQLFVRRHKTVTTLAVSILVLATVAGIVSTTLWLGARSATTTAIEENKVATRALSTLKDCAPDMIELSRMFIQKGQLDEALKRRCYAVQLIPDNAQYRYLQGNTLQTLLRLQEAEGVYENALRLDPNHSQARENKLLCRRILDNNRGLKLLTNVAASELFTAMRSQERYDEAIAVAQWMIANSGGTAVENLMKDILARAGIKYNTLTIDSQGVCHLSLTDVSDSDLVSLRGLPLNHLSLYATHVQDLSTLAGLPLTWLDIGRTRIGDLSPLNGMPLAYLKTDHNSVTDLSPLKGSPLKNLILWGNRIGEVSILKGIPVTDLDLRDTGFQDFPSLKDLPLTNLVINGITDLSLLKDLKLTGLNLGGARCTDLLPLKTLPLERLILQSTPVSDLAPLRGMSLIELDISNTPVTDLSPLNDLPLQKLRLDEGKLRLLSQVRTLKTLNTITGCDLTQFLTPCNEALTRKNFTLAGQEATRIATEWENLTAMTNVCRLAKWIANVSVPLAERSDHFGPGTVSRLGHHYCQVPIAMKWDEAKTFCENLGGHLVTPSSKETWSWLLETFPDTNLQWLGGFKDPVSGQWKWVTGEKWNYAAWSSGQPDNFKGNETVIQVLKYGFNDVNRDLLSRFIIEWDR